MACVYFQDQHCKNIVVGCFSLELFKIKMQSSITQQDKRPKTFQFIPLCTKFSCFKKLKQFLGQRILYFVKVLFMYLCD